MKFLFDLDGTITSHETLPVIASHFGCNEEIEELTKHTIAGNVPFVESFIRRVQILSRFSVCETDTLLAQVPIHKNLLNFINAHKEDCVVVTGNLNCWCESLFLRIGCKCFGSEADVQDDHIVKLKKI